MEHGPHEPDEAIAPSFSEERIRTSIAIAVLAIIGAWAYQTDAFHQPRIEQQKTLAISGERESSEDILTLPVRWGDLGVKMVGTGVIDVTKLEALYAARGGLDAASRKLLESAENGNLTMTEENAGFVLNLLWALGLGTKNAILEQGPMADPSYGGAERFASTGGWSLAAGNAMNHYSHHPFIVLSPPQQELAERVAKNIYRPCCNNATYFPDCNHGMAMLGLLELMASQNVTEDEMYRVALHVNELWFPDHYATMATYLATKDVRWEDADPREVLGATFSSGSGYQKIQSEITTPRQQGGGSCGV